jgi:glucans biosynthesis protein C
MSREHHLDALRAAAILLLVPYHGLGFLRNAGNAPDWVPAAAFYIHTFHMPLFFALSGYLAASAVARRGSLASAKERLLRLGVPLLVALGTVIPLINLVVGHYGRNGPHGPHTLGDIFNIQPLHLWFLVYLLILSFGAIGLRTLLRERPAATRIRGAFRTLLASPLALPALAIAAGGVLTLAPDWEASRTVGGTFTPEPALLAYYSIFFGFGWLLSSNRDLLPRIEGNPGRRLLLGAAAAAVAYIAYRGRRDSGMQAWHVPTLLLGSGFACWFTLCGFWGAFAQRLPRPNAMVIYLADASFWIYLVHLPALVLVESALATTGLPAGARFALAVTATLGFALLTCALFVRRTAIGRFLRGGKRLEPMPAPATA